MSLDTYFYMITYIREWVLSIIELESSENLISLSDYAPVCRRAGIMKRLHRLEILN